jgi:hypothetical protein
LMAERKPESKSMTTNNQKIITIKRELDKAVQERMKLSKIYCRQNNSRGVVAVPTAASA